MQRVYLWLRLERQFLRMAEAQGTRPNAAKAVLAVSQRDSCRFLGNASMELKLEPRTLTTVASRARFRK